MLLARVMLVWFKLLNAELSPKRYWRRPRSQEVGEEGDCTERRLQALVYDILPSWRKVPESDARGVYLTLHCHHQNDSCINMGIDESHLNVSLIVRDKITKSVSTDHNF